MNNINTTIFLIGAIIIMIFLQIKINKIEGYHLLKYYRNYKKYCPDCGYKNKRNCYNCVNCGVCWTPDGNPECVPGDRNGPYFRADCNFWKYDKPYNPYFRYSRYNGYPSYYGYRRQLYKNLSYW